ncbi:hypothetical protein ABKN59_006402 [Abortiporus biennis]
MALVNMYGLRTAKVDLTNISTLFIGFSAVFLVLFKNAIVSYAGTLDVNAAAYYHGQPWESAIPGGYVEQSVNLLHSIFPPNSANPKMCHFEVHCMTYCLINSNACSDALMSHKSVYSTSAHTLPPLGVVFPDFENLVTERGRRRSSGASRCQPKKSHRLDAGPSFSKENHTHNSQLHSRGDSYSSLPGIETFDAVARGQPPSSPPTTAPSTPPTPPSPSLSTTDSQSSGRPRRYECPICHSYFDRPSSLKTHNNMHTKEQPYECSRCGKRFSVNSNRLRHERRHTPSPDSSVARQSIVDELQPKFYTFVMDSVGSMNPNLPISPMSPAQQSGSHIPSGSSSSSSTSKEYAIHWQQRCKDIFELSNFSEWYSLFSEDYRKWSSIVPSQEVAEPLALQLCGPKHSAT